MAHAMTVSFAFIASHKQAHEGKQGLIPITFFLT